MQKFIATPVKIEHNGSVVVNSAEIVYRSDKSALIIVDCHSRGFSVEFQRPGHVYFIADEYTSHTRRCRSKIKWTIISFPEFKEWDVFAVFGSKYTANVCLFERKSIYGHEE